MDPSQIRQRLGRPVPIRVFESLGSTNGEARAWALAGAPHGACVLAESQTAGRGRQGRDFFSPPGGIYLSLILRGSCRQKPNLTAQAAVAVCRAVSGLTGRELSIKWVNDLLLNGRKVCGILTEGVGGWEEGAAVVGIGLNTGDTQFPEELKDRAGTLQLPAGVSREALAARIIRGVLDGCAPEEPFMEEYRRRCLTLGRQVRFSLPGGGEAEGLALGVDDEGALQVRTAQGRDLRLLSGEVSVRLFNGLYA